jgi:hypothetical protein
MKFVKKTTEQIFKLRKSLKDKAMPVTGREGP